MGWLYQLFFLRIHRPKMNWKWGATGLLPKAQWPA